MAVNAFAIVGSGAIGTVVSQLLPNSILIGRKETPLSFKGSEVINYSKTKEACRSSFTVIFCVKTYDMYNAVKETLPYLKKEQNVILLSNGFAADIVYKRLLSDFPHVWAGFTTIAAEKKNGDVKLNNIGFLSLAPLSESPQQLPRFLNLKVLISSYRLLSFQKAVINSIINPIAVIFETRNGEIIKNSWLQELMEQAYKEAEALSDAIPIAMDDLHEITSVIQDTGQNTCSTLQDFRNGNRSELPLITGRLLRIFRKHGVECELIRSLYHLCQEKFRLRDNSE